MLTDRIDLAHQADFAIGPLLVRPSTREIERGTDRVVIEPRVMQVLVALAEAQGAVLSKDDLISRCWHGRIVGEDAINRVISRLRRLEAGIAQGVFQVETVTRVGYRLKTDSDEAPHRTVLQTQRPRGITARRTILVGGAAAVLGSAMIAFYPRKPAIPEGLADMIDKTRAALNYNTPEQNDAAVGIMREAVRSFPDRAEPWGLLAVAYRQQVLNSRLPKSEVTMARARAAARRAVELDADNRDGAVVLALGGGLWHHRYADYDRITGRTLARFPDNETARRARTSFLFETGRVRESIEVGAPLVDPQLPLPASASQAIRLWSGGRAEEAEALLDTLIERWPRHYSVWATRYKFLMFSGHHAKARAMLEAIPVGLQDIDFAILSAQTEAIATQAPAAIDAALAEFDKLAPTVAHKAQEAVGFAAYLARPDAAFRYLDLYYRSAEYIRSYRKRLPAGRTFSHSGCMTHFLFEPPLQALRADARFAAVVEELGLAAYWRTSKAKPDFASGIEMT